MQHRINPFGLAVGFVLALVVGTILAALSWTDGRKAINAGAEWEGEES